MLPVPKKIRSKTSRNDRSFIVNYRQRAGKDGGEPLQEQLTTAGTLSSSSGISVLMINNGTRERGARLKAAGEGELASCRLAMTRIKVA